MKSYLSFITLALLLTACGSNNNSNNIAIEGYVIDGYLGNSKVFSDQNDDGMHDSDETLTRTDNSGKYKLTLAAEDTDKPIVACFDAAAADTDADSILEERVEFCMSAPPPNKYTDKKSLHITPFSSMVRSKMLDDELSFADAKTAIAATLTELEITDFDVMGDYIAKEKTVERENDEAKKKKFKRLRDLARITAKGMQDDAKEIREDILDKDKTVIKADTDSKEQYKQLIRYKKSLRADSLQKYALKMKERYATESQSKLTKENATEIFTEVDTALETEIEEKVSADTDLAIEGKEALKDDYKKSRKFTTLKKESASRLTGKELLAEIKKKREKRKELRKKYY